MENKEYHPTWVAFEEEEEVGDELSFSNFSMIDNKESSTLQSPRDSVSAEEFFEFFTELSPGGFSAPDVMFCGRIMNDHDQDELNEYQKRDYLAMIRSKSSRRPASYDQYPFLNHETDIHSLRRNRSISLRFSTSQSPKYSVTNVHRVNITSLTSMSATSRRRMFMFGPVKFKPEMELSAIKERQGRRVPATMFPAGGGGKIVASGSGKAGRKSSQWGMLRALMGRANLTDVLTRSFGCMQLPGGKKRKKAVN